MLCGGVRTPVNVITHGEVNNGIRKVGHGMVGVGVVGGDGGRRGGHGCAELLSLEHKENESEDALILILIEVEVGAPPSKSAPRGRPRRDVLPNGATHAAFPCTRAQVIM